MVMFETIPTAARLVRHIVVRTNAPEEIIIKGGDMVASAKAMTAMLPTQTRAVKWILSADGLSFPRIMRRKVQGVK